MGVTWGIAEERAFPKVRGTKRGGNKREGSEATGGVEILKKNFARIATNWAIWKTARKKTSK